jgi:general secretion pathway protein D
LIRRIPTMIATLLTAAFLMAPLPASAKGVVLNFSDVEISTMVKFISDLTGKNIVMDDRVKGKISIFSPGKLSTEEAFSVFTSVLELKGFTVVPAGKVYKIVPTALAKQSGMKLYTEQERAPVNEAYTARVVTLESISAQEAVPFLQPIVSKDGYITSFGPTNMLLVVDSAINIEKVLDILQKIDSNQSREGGELVYLKNASAESVAEVVREWLGSRSKSRRPGVPAAAGNQGISSGVGGLIVPDTRLNALILFGTEQDKDDIKKLIALIDVPPLTSSSKVNVYYLENADATEVAKVLDGVVKGSAATATAPRQAGAAASPFEGGKISITPDKATNSLVIMASPNDYQNLLQVVQKLDRRRRQVFVQAIIAEITPDKLKDLGVQLGASGGGVKGNTAVAGAFDPFNFAGATDPAQAAVLAFLQSQLNNTNLQIAGNIKALNTEKAVNVLSTPTILTSDNKEAEIFVGQNVPFISTSSAVTGGIVQQSVTRQDVGIKLKITPQISEGEYVKLDISQEISAVTGDKGQATDIVTTTRSAKTSVVVKDKDTVVIGGLIQDQDQETVSKIPLLGDIPLLGWLFKTSHKERTKTNLLIVLTPRIIRGAEEMAEVTADQKQKFGEAIRTDQPFNLDRELKLKP